MMERVWRQRAATGWELEWAGHHSRPETDGAIRRPWPGTPSVFAVGTPWEPPVPEHSPNESSSTSAASAVARVYWMIAGNCLLYIAALAILDRAWGVAAEALFWTIVSSLVAVRYLDVRFLGGATASGSRASLRDWSRYSRTLLAVALGVWGTGRALARVEPW